MIAPPLPLDEHSRLERLRILGLLDHEPIAQLDRLPRLITRHCALPIAMVSLTDVNRQWFLARTGVDMCEINREHSFCGHAILRPDIMQVPDARRDLRFADNPLVVIAPAAHRLAGKRLRWEDLAEEPFISRETGSGTRRAIEEHFARFGWSLRPRMTIESNEAIKESVAAGLGIAIVSRHTLVHTAPGNLVELEVEQFPIPNRWYLVRWRGKALSPVAAAFSEFVREGDSLLISN